jgi:hypothetical protein
VTSSPVAQRLSDHAAHVVVVIVEDEDRRGDLDAGEDILGREDIGGLAAGDGADMGAGDPVLAPLGTDGDHHMGETKLADLGGGESAGPGAP